MRLGQQRLALLAKRIAAFGRATRGGVAMLTAICVPPITLAAVGAIQIQDVWSSKSRMQDAADAAALWGAQQLTISPDGATERTKAWALAQIPGVIANATSVSATATVTGWRTMKVTVDANLPSFFMNTFPAGGFDLHAESVAEGMSQSPLCVLITGPAASDDITMQNSSKLTGPLCLIHSNQDISVAGTAMLKGATVEAATSASGPITPAASTGAPPLPDPFAAIDTSFPTPCGGSPGSLPWVPYNSSTTLPPGVHCFNLDVKNGVVLRLGAGNHYFGGSFSFKNSASLVGDDVALVFAPGVDLDFKSASNVSLSGRQSGPLAGFVMIVDRTNTSYMQLDADHISSLTGTVYSPNAVLRIGGSGNALSSSAWTVVAARAVEISGSPNLIINADYTGSVPVPVGVGNNAGVTHITQ